MNRQRIIALLGRRDEPTDGVEDYCRFLGEALGKRDFDLQLVRVDFVSRGWPTALEELRRRAVEWHNCWVLVQYTALAWSKRGFPWRFIFVLKTLRRAGTRIAIVFHDAEPFGGRRLVDKLRRLIQLRTMCAAGRLSDFNVTTLEKISWAKFDARKSVFIPVGANLPQPIENGAFESRAEQKIPVVAVYGITGGDAGRQESKVICEAARFAAARIGKLRLRVFGRHAEDAEPFFRKDLSGSTVDLEIYGVLPDHEVAHKFDSAHVSLFVRGPISSRRGSAIAGIAYGLPVIAYRGSETAFPITEAGVVLVSQSEPSELPEALTRVLSDPAYRASLSEQSRRAYEHYFSWEAIAGKYARVLSPTSSQL